ncbi:hypothetical protein H5410_036526 [Solanum commersonii]|uniref:Uncharacterized protein n=1 Tax=Solanum commersonii TaxID=4109 RepID=A0A9J5Y8F0_SOLCO|nr:hypothetical protein H5410_036526 [Solanum commersonii]
MLGFSIPQKDESEYYCKLVLSKGKEFSSLVKVDRNFSKVEKNMNVIAMEIHEVERNMKQMKARTFESEIKIPKIQHTNARGP